MIKAIDLFAGCGGFSCGFSQAGIPVIVAVEYDKDIAASYVHNHPKTKMIVDDIKNVDNKKNFSKHMADIIVGGPPCQGFSTAGARIRHGFIDDPRNYLFKHYFNIVKLVKPKIFIFENVKGIISYDKGRVFAEIRKAFESLGYKLQYTIAKAKDFGIPQARERTILIGRLVDFDLQTEIEQTKKYLSDRIPGFFDAVSVWDAISNLPNPSTTGVIKNVVPNNAYTKSLQSQDVNLYNHIATKHNKTAMRRMKEVQQGKNFKVLKEHVKSVHSGSYGRLMPDGIAPTITTRFDTPSGGCFTHPFCDRTLTPREAARIQSFPDGFQFIGSKTSVCKQIGNAVPPKLAYFFATMIKRILKDDSARISSDTDE